MSLTNTSLKTISRKTRRSGLLYLLFFLWAILIFGFFLKNHPWQVNLWLSALQRINIAGFLPTASGLEMVFSHLSLLVLIFYLAYAVGVKVINLSRLNLEDDPVERFLYAEAFGFACFMLLSFLFGALGLYNKRAVDALGILLIVITIPEGVRLGVNVFGYLRKAREKEYEGSPLSRVLVCFTILALVLVIFSILVVALTPAVDWDSQSYHLNIPRRYVLAGGIVRVPFNMFANMPHYMELLYAFCLVLQDYVLAKLLHFGFGILVIILTYHFARKTFSRRVALLSLPILLFNEDVISSFALSFVDFALTFFYFLSFTSLVHWLDSKKTSWLIVCGFLLGCCLGTKLTIGLGLIPIGLIVGWTLFVKDRKDFRVSVKKFCYFTLALLIPFVPWLIKNEIYVGNPVYPLLYNIFGGEELSPALYSRWTHYLKAGFGMPHTLLNYLILPWNVTIHGSRDFRLFGSTVTPLWLICLPFVLVVPKGDRRVRLLIFVVGIYYLAWMFYIQYVRYAFPVFCFVSILSAYVIEELFLKPRSDIPGGLRKLMASFCITLITLTAVPLFSGRVLGSAVNYLPVVLGNYNRKVFEYESNPNYFMFEYINGKLPSDSRILFVWENRAFFSDRDVVADVHPVISHVFDMFGEWQSTREALSGLKQRGITHILINTTLRASTPEYLSDEFHVDQAERRKTERGEALFEEFKNNCCEFLFRDNGLEIYRIRY